MVRTLSLILARTLIILFVILEGLWLSTKVSSVSVLVKAEVVVVEISSVLSVNPIESLIGMISF